MVIIANLYYGMLILGIYLNEKYKGYFLILFIQIFFSIKYWFPCKNRGFSLDTVSSVKNSARQASLDVLSQVKTARLGLNSFHYLGTNSRLGTVSLYLAIAAQFLRI